MKKIAIGIILILGFLMNSCSTKVISERNQSSNKILFEEDLKQRLGIYGQVYRLSSINPSLNKNNFRYKMLIVDTRSWTDKRNKILKTRRSLKKFGEELGKKAIVLNLILKTSQKRKFFQDIQENLNKDYNVDKDAPFLIFYRPNSISKRYVPFEIVSLSSISQKYLDKKLSLLGDAIGKGKSKRKVIASLKKIENNLYAKRSSIKIKKIINILIEWIL